MSLFLSVAHTELLRELRAGRRALPTPRFLAAKMALSDQLQPDDETTAALLSAFREPNESDARSMAIGAFWRYAAPTIALAPAARQLLINPPIGLKIEDARTLVTIRSEPWADKYGFTCAALHDPVIDQAAGGDFEDVAVFFNERMPPNAWLPRVRPGTTITVYFPAPHHMPWIGFFGLRPFMPQDTEMTTFHEVFDGVSGEVLTSVYGTEGRG